MCLLPKVDPSQHRTVLQKCLRHHFHKRHYSLAFLSRTIIEKAYRIETVAPLCLYSTQGFGVKGLADETLKSKINTQENEQEHKKQDSSESDGANKKESRWTGKNAWKMGLIFMSGWSVLTAAGMLYIWG